MKNAVSQTNNPDLRVKQVFDFAVVCYGDPEMAHAFLNEMHRGSIPAALGMDGDDYVRPRDEIRRNPESADKLIDYLRRQHA